MCRMLKACNLSQSKLLKWGRITICVFIFPFDFDFLCDDVVKFFAESASVISNVAKIIFQTKLLVTKLELAL